MTEYGELKCGTCRHWFQEDVRVRNNLDPNRPGFCRESPPIIVLAGLGPQGIQNALTFPQMTPDSLACSHYVAAEPKSQILV